MTTRYEAVLFDLDGTLIDSREDISAAVNHVRETLGLPRLPVSIVQTYVGDGVRVLLERALATQDTKVLEQGLTILRPYYLDHCLDRTTLYPGIQGMLDALASIPGLRLGVVSNKPEGPSEKVLTGLGVRDRFAVVVGGDTTPARKPDPEPFRVAAEKAGVTGGRILVVGDSRNDIEGARRAGFASCGVLWGIGSPESVRDARPDHLAVSPEDVQRLVMAGSPEQGRSSRDGGAGMA
jgi:2-phosphoglycolate phosphatase